MWLADWQSIAFDPEDPDILVAGGRDSGVFVSTNGGASWSLVTDPFDSGKSGTPHLPRPRFAYFDHEPADRLNVYVGTQGRGVWRITAPVVKFCLGQPATIIGTTGNDVLVGTPGDDVIVGLGGNDAIVGKGGNDRLCGGEGNDTISGGIGDDQIDVGLDFNRIDGGPGTDVCVNGPIFARCP